MITSAAHAVSNGAGKTERLGRRTWRSLQDAVQFLLDVMLLLGLLLGLGFGLLRRILTILRHPRQRLLAARVVLPHVGWEDGLGWSGTFGGGGLAKPLGLLEPLSHLPPNLGIIGILLRHALDGLLAEVAGSRLSSVGLHRAGTRLADDGG